MIARPEQLEPDHDHDSVQCSACEMGMDKVAEFDRKAMEKFGWYCHFVPGDEQSPTGLNMHTHGLTVSRNHPDLQLVLPLSMQILHGVFCRAIQLIDEGRPLEAGQIRHDILSNEMPVRIVKATECDRSVLRIILPDENGCVDSGELDELYNKQYD